MQIFFKIYLISWKHAQSSLHHGNCKIIFCFNKCTILLLHVPIIYELILLCTLYTHKECTITWKIITCSTFLFVVRSYLFLLAIITFNNFIIIDKWIMDHWNIFHYQWIYSIFSIMLFFIKVLKIKILWNHVFQNYNKQI